MVKDHSDSERGNLLSPHGLLFLISSMKSHRIAHTTAFVTPVVDGNNRFTIYVYIIWNQ